MPTLERDNPFSTLSEAMADTIAKAGASTVLVDARQRLPASGISYTANLVLTASHVIERDEDIRVMLPDGSQLPAALAGRDPGSDLALLRLESAVLTPAQAAARPARIGQLVLALGRPTSNGIQASLGIVSALGGPARTAHGSFLESYLRTDAIPYPGFSGGPLVNASGEILGLNTSGLAHGASITIPASLAWQTAETLAKHGHIRRGYLGIRSQPVVLPAAQRQTPGRDQETGLLLVGIEQDSPAATSGLLVGDILVGLAGEPVSDPDQLLYRLVGDIVGKQTSVEIIRGGQLLTIQVKIGER